MPQLGKVAGPYCHTFVVTARAFAITEGNHTHTHRSEWWLRRRASVLIVVSFILPLNKSTRPCCLYVCVCRNLSKEEMFPSSRCNSQLRKKKEPYGGLDSTLLVLLNLTRGCEINTHILFCDSTLSENRTAPGESCKTYQQALEGGESESAGWTL